MGSLYMILLVKKRNNMNWYKTANLWEEIKRHGPKSTSFLSKDIPYDEGEYETLVQYLQNKLNYSQEQAKQYLDTMPESQRRDYFIHNYGWSVPTQEAITELKKFIGNDTVLSIGSGYGLWAKLLQNIGINAIATTRLSDQDKGHMPKENHFFTEVENLDNIDSLNKYPEAGVLMMSWPPYNDTMAYDTLFHFRGNKIIYIGEGLGGCTGCDRFHNLLYNEWKEVEDMYIDIPQWQGIHDQVALYTRK